MGPPQQGMDVIGRIAKSNTLKGIPGGQMMGNFQGGGPPPQNYMPPNQSGGQQHYHQY